MTTIREATIRIVAEKLREYYLRGIRDARIEAREYAMPSILEKFDPGSFDSAPDQNVWLRLAEDIVE
jgi:hypothetical protein